MYLEEHPGIFKALTRAVRAKLRTMEVRGHAFVFD
jgi:hypothetical protein